MNIRKIALWAVLLLAFGRLDPEQRAILAPQALFAAGTNYYVDSVSGSDSNSGTLTTKPWKSLTNLQNRHFLPGDTVNFKRGSSWTGQLYIQDSGVEGNPITFRGYGSGARPIISYPSSGPGQFVIILRANWVVVQGLLVKDSGDAAVELDTGSNHNIIQDLEVTNAGMGVAVNGQNNLVTNNYAHDLKMVRNTPGGDDDFGAVGFLITNRDNEVSLNRCTNCRAPSYDYEYDGGVVEIYSNGDNAYIHNNYGTASNGFIEVGGATARNVRVAYNVSDNNYSVFACLHVGGTFSSTLDNFRIENNTIVNRTGNGGRVIDCAPTILSSTQLLFRNNIVYSNMDVFYQSAFTHVDNIYYLTGGALVGFPLGSGEQLVDPAFVDVTGGNYQLQSSSPAVNSGLSLGYAMDFGQTSVPQGGAPDIGAYELVKTAQSSPVASSVFLPLLQH